jgi:uncharacterized caspase-like protein
MGRLFLLVVGILAVSLLRADAQAPRRVALVIGNAAYENAAALANPVNDAIDVAAKLRSLGFEVIEGRDLGKRAMERTIGAFSDALQGASVGMLYYAGHGIQVDGRNFIVPTDARLDVPVKLRLEAVPIDDILDIMEQQTSTSLVFLDACRNNPFTRSLGGSSRSAVPLQGLAQFNAARGSFIAFSTAPGAVAMDGSGRNSPFAEALVRHIATPGQSINDLMIAVRTDVLAATRQQQRPWEQGSLTERFAFLPDGSAAIAAAPTAATVPQVASLERSVGGDGSVETFIRDVYLGAAPGRVEEMARRAYADPARVYGAPLSLDALVSSKTDWFSQWSSWSLALIPGTLAITMRGEDAADVAFAMSYDYVPRDPAAARATGRARVQLGLTRAGAGWRVASETSQAVP